MEAFDAVGNLTGRLRLLRLMGDLHAATVVSARRRLWPDVTRFAEFVVDMEAVPYLDSAGLGLLIAIHREVARRGGRWALVGASAQATRLLAVTQADHFLPLFPSVADVETAWHDHRASRPEERDTANDRHAEPSPVAERLIR